MSKKILMHRECWFFFCLIWQAIYCFDDMEMVNKLCTSLFCIPFYVFHCLRFMMTFLTIFSHTPIYRLWRNHFYAYKSVQFKQTVRPIYIHIYNISSYRLFFGLVNLRQGFFSSVPIPKHVRPIYIRHTMKILNTTPKHHPCYYFPFIQQKVKKRKQ